MNTREETTRFTIDIPKDFHRKMKTKAATVGKSMREIVLELMSEYVGEEKCLCNQKLNQETIDAFDDAKNKKNLTKANNTQDLFKKLGI